MIAGVPRKNANTFPRELEALFRRCGQLVYRAAYNVTGNREDAQDGQVIEASYWVFDKQDNLYAGDTSVGRVTKWSRLGSDKR